MSKAGKENPALNLYNRIVDGAVRRAFSIDQMIAGTTGISNELKAEYGYLQLRMLCEGIALGCLVAHEDLMAMSELHLRQQYKPEKIMGELEKLHPEFFPKATATWRTGPTSHQYDDRAGDFITKDGLLRLWNVCGANLHLGSYRDLIKKQPPPRRAFLDIQGYGRQIFDLLRCHRIARLGGQTVFISTVDGMAGNFNVFSFVAEANNPEEPLS